MSISWEAKAIRLLVLKRHFLLELHISTEDSNRGNMSIGNGIRASLFVFLMKPKDDMLKCNIMVMCSLSEAKIDRSVKLRII